jgi:hypothetical protein
MRLTYRLVTRISALIPEGLLIQPQIVSVPAEEIGLRHNISRARQAQLSPVAATGLTVRWMDVVLLICRATQSSKRFLAPGAIDEGTFGGFFIKHCTAAM